MPQGIALGLDSGSGPTAAMATAQCSAMRVAEAVKSGVGKILARSLAGGKGSCPPLCFRCFLCHLVVVVTPGTDVPG